MLRYAYNVESVNPCGREDNRQVGVGKCDRQIVGVETPSCGFGPTPDSNNLRREKALVVTLRMRHRQIIDRING